MQSAPELHLLLRQVVPVIVQLQHAALLLVDDPRHPNMLREQLHLAQLRHQLLGRDLQLRQGAERLHKAGIGQLQRVAPAGGRLQYTLHLALANGHGLAPGEHMRALGALLQQGAQAELVLPQDRVLPEQLGNGALHCTDLRRVLLQRRLHLSDRRE